MSHEHFVVHTSDDVFPAAISNMNKEELHKHIKEISTCGFDPCLIICNKKLYEVDTNAVKVCGIIINISSE